ncbi:TPA: antitoxin [Candidatus Acetothermia bacterium]|nr:antitoxin [Candidatus Acetothermia bacterium]
MKKWIVADREHLGGAPRIRDTRISISLLLELLSSGMTISEIVKEYPSLSEEAVRGALEELAHSDLLTVR